MYALRKSTRIPEAELEYMTLRVILLKTENRKLHREKQLLQKSIRHLIQLNASKDRIISKTEHK